MLAMLERHGDDRTLLMDGIFVASHARGKGIGSILLRAIEEQAVVLQKDRVRLDVIDTNPRAKALYERFGYQADGGRRTGPLSYLFGFEAATTMYKSVVPQSTE
jgi:ribosomal protein S18 acetylase RimI-like enzyme